LKKIPFDNRQKCQSCYQTVPDICCTCEEVEAYHKARDWIIESPSLHPLCQKVDPDTPNTINSGCRVKGTMNAFKGSGHFHIAPGTSTMGLSGHTHTMNPFSLMEDLKKVKLSHTINYLGFGTSFPDQVNPLTGVEFQTEMLVRHMYYIRLVPTTYNDGYLSMKTYQYAVTNHTDEFDIVNDPFSIQLPGVWFKYDFSPMLVQLEKRPKYFTHLLTRICAAVGGIWVVLGLIHSVSKHFIDKLNYKKK